MEGKSSLLKRNFQHSAGFTPFNLISAAAQAEKVPEAFNMLGMPPDKHKES
jgi:hypothetical protein